MDFGVWLAQQRRQAGLTLRELANKSGLSFPYVAGIERSTSDPPPLRTCKALARGLNLSWQEIWRHSFAARLKKWLKREGYARISEAEVLEIARRIDSAAQEPVSHRKS